MRNTYMKLYDLLEAAAAFIGSTGADIRKALEENSNLFESALWTGPKKESDKAISKLCSSAITPFFIDMARESNTFRSILEKTVAVRYSFYEAHPNASNGKCCIIDATNAYGVIVYKQNFQDANRQSKERLMVLKHFSTQKTKEQGIATPSNLEVRRIVRK